MDRTAQATEGVNQKLAGFAKAAVAALAVKALAAVKEFVDDSVRAYSQLEQAVGGTEAVFGPAGRAIDEFGKKSADAIGLSESEFRTATTSIGGQLKRMTGDVDFAAEHSIILTQVAADLAATYGGTTAEAVGALGAAFRGEADPAERFNLDLKVGRVNAKALQMGLADASGAISDQARAQALLALITEQSADAQGQFAREADTVEGAAQRANAAIENQKAVMGEALVPVKELQTAVGLLGAKTMGVLANAFLDLTGKISEAESVTRNFQILTGQTADSLEAAVTINKEYGVSFEELFKTMEFAEGALKPLTQSQKDYLTQIGYTEDEIKTLESEIRKYIETQRQAAQDVARGRGREEEYAEALRGTKGAAEGATGALKLHAEEIRAQLDPVFAARKAERELADAIAAVAQAAADHGEGSPEHIAALEDATDASLNLKSAQEKVAEAGGLTRDEFVRQQIELGRTRTEAELLASEYDHLFTPRTVTHSINIRENVRTGQVGGEGIAGHRASGGEVAEGMPYVVGEGGREVFVPDQDGSIVPNHRLRRGGGEAAPMSVVNVTVNALDPGAAARAVIQAIQKYIRDNGGRQPW